METMDKKTSSPGEIILVIVLGIIGVVISFVISSVLLMLFAVIGFFGLLEYESNTSYEVTAVVNETERDEKDGTYENERVTIKSVEGEGRKDESYTPEVGDELIVHHYLMHNTRDEVGSELSFKIRDGEIYEGLTKYYEILEIKEKD